MHSKPFADDVEMVTPRTQNTNLHSSLIAAWDWSQKLDLPVNPAKCNHLTIVRRLSTPDIAFFP